MVSVEGGQGVKRKGCGKDVHLYIYIYHISQSDGSTEGRKEDQEPESSMDKGTWPRALNGSNLKEGAFVGKCRSTDLRSTALK